MGSGYQPFAGLLVCCGCLSLGVGVTLPRIEKTDRLLYAIKRERGEIFACGHPRTPENTNGQKKPRCKACDNANYNPLAARVRYLPKQLEATRRKLEMLESEARRYGMTDLLEVGK